MSTKITEYQSALKRLGNRKEIAKSSLRYDLGLFFAVYICFKVTPLFRRYPSEMVTFVAILVVLFLIRYVFRYFEPESLRSIRLYIVLQNILFTLWGLTWGLFASYVILATEISWTTYIVTLVSMGLVASTTLLTSTSLTLMVISQFSILLPILASSALFIPGQRGDAISLLMGFFAIMTFLMGRTNNRIFREVMKQKARFAAILESMPGALCWFDKSLRLIGANSWFRRSWCEGGEATPESIVDDQVAEPIREMASRLSSSEREELSGVREPKGHPYYIVGRKYNFEDEAVLVGIDLSHQALLEQQLEENRSRMLYRALDLERSPILLLLSEKMSELLAQKELPENGKSELEAVNSLLNLVMTCEIESDRDFDSEELCANLHRIFAQVTADQLIDFQIRNELPGAMGDKPGHFVVALSLLILNSIDALGEKADPREIRLDMTLDENKKVLRVIDNGSGIEGPYEDMVFEPFITTKAQSTGLGLQVVKQLFDQCRADIRIESVADPTVFRIELPVESA